MTECSWTDTLENDTVFFDLDLDVAFFVDVNDEVNFSSSAGASKGEIFSQPNVVGLEERERADRLTKFGRICVSSVPLWPTTMSERKLPDGVSSMMSGVKDILVEDADCSSR